MQQQFAKSLPPDSVPFSEWQTLACEQRKLAEECFCSLLAEFIQTHIALIDRSLIRDLSYLSADAYYDKGMQVCSVEYLSDAQFMLHFAYPWTIFQACLGFYEEGHCHDKVRFSVDQCGHLMFDLTAFGELSTADEW